MTRNTLLLLLTSILCGVGGQFLLKAGATALGPVSSDNLGQKLLHMTLQPLLWGGLGLYGIGAIAYIMVLSRAKLSAAAPVIAMSYVFTVLGGNFIFGEAIPLIRWVGVAFIIAGVIMVVSS
ncbi:EamA family transporter [Trichothermofontia sichuanensis B231]|uniref:EamA family transporter n=1 Tax=Trichothermofontia sichuanensis TaxID=3045816 RepID=UPI0022465243|nr:EamA family transporter [Trichothermofontia sichuanensis]UZQ52931.1 EamA family transporter [Trichothermofontia sichuanensis B231]